MEVLENPSATEDNQTRYLIQVARAERLQEVALPLVRITTCGTLSIEVLHAVHPGEGGHVEAVYGPPDATLLAKKGTSTAFILLALLASQPGCFAPKDWLSEKLGHLRDVEGEDDEEDGEESEGLKRVDNVVSRLRHLLFPSQPNEPPEAKLLRRRLVEYQRASGESGPGYQLAGMPLVWLDVAEIDAHIKRARRPEQFSTDGLSEWRAAYDLAMGGRFLPGEIYSDWAEWRRQVIETQLWDCVQVLWHRYVEDGAAGETEALRILRDYWQSHVTKEDALRPLLELLGKRECYGQAEDYYQQLCAALAAEGKQPDQRTREIIDFQQAVQIQCLPGARPSPHFPETSIVEIGTAPANAVDAPCALAAPGGEASGVSFSLPHIALDQNEAHASERLSGNAERLIGHVHAHASQAPISQLWYVPHLRNPFFTGREELLTHLHDVLHAEKTIVAVTQHALCGLGGIGKTQVALEYAYRYRQEYRAVFWVKADTRENVLADLRAIACLLQLPEQSAEDRTVTVAAVKRWFQSYERWLLILDNADDLMLAREFLPTGNQGHILLTTRSQALGGLAYGVEIEVMNQHTGALFLLRRAGLLAPNEEIGDQCPADYQFAQELVREVGGLPLALDQAGAYIEETSSSLQDYLEVYKAHRFALLQRRGGLTTDHPEPVATTWELAFTSVEQMNPIAANLLRLCAFFDPDIIPEELLLTAVIYLPQAPAEFDRHQLNEAISVLLRFSLVRRNRESQTLTLHRLVQVILQQAMEKEAQRIWAVRAAQAVYQAFPQDSTVYSSSGYPSQAVQRLTASIILDREQKNHEGLAHELWNLAVQQQVIGKLSASEQNLQTCLALCQKHHDLFNQAKALQYFALLRAYQGDFPEAAKNLDEALTLFQRRNAFQDAGIVWAYRSLCSILSGDIAHAYDAAMRAWKQAKAQGIDRDLLRARWLLGWIAIQNGSRNTEHREQYLEEANQHLRDALDRCKRTHMVDYEADLLLAWARLYTVQGNNCAAISSATEALTIANQSNFRLLQADIHLVLAQNFLLNNLQEAEKHTKIAIEAAICEGSSYSYIPALLQAKNVLWHIQTTIQEKGRDA